MFQTRELKVFDPGDQVTWDTSESGWEKLAEKYPGAPFTVCRYQGVTYETFSETVNRCVREGSNDRSARQFPPYVWVDINGKEHQFAAVWFVKVASVAEEPVAGE